MKGTGSQRTWNRRRTFATRRKSVFGKEKQAQTKQDTSMSPFGRVMTARLARILAEELGEEAPSDPDFNSVVIFSQRLMRSGRGQARQSGRRALRRLLGDFLPQMFKTATSVLSKEVIADAFATATPMVAEWLVGRSEKVSGIAQPKGGTAEVDGEIRERPDEPAVLIPKCRILDESGCMGVCANVRAAFPFGKSRSCSNDGWKWDRRCARCRPRSSSQKWALSFGWSPIRRRGIALLHGSGCCCVIGRSRRQE